MVNDDMGDTDGVLMFDESGFVKKGKDSAGVQRQYCGNIGLDGKIYFVSIASDTKCWLKTPATTPKEYTYKDETHAKIVLRDTLGNRAMF